MINPKLIEHIFAAASIQRWNDYPRMTPLVELDKQAHKMIIAYFIAKLENDVDMTKLIDSAIFEFLRRVVVTDIRPDVFRQALQRKKDEINTWVISKLSESLEEIDNRAFLNRFKEYLLDEEVNKKERFILQAASYLSTRWEFGIIYQTSSFLHDIDRVKKDVEDEIEDYYELIGVRKIALNKKLSKIIDLSGRLRFQKRWAQTPRIPETSVLGHMLTVAIFAYFYSLKIDACQKRVQNNFFCALFHDLPEALTRDIISPVKYSVSGLDDIIQEYEIKRIKEDIIPYIPLNLINEFKYLLGMIDDKKDEFTNRIYLKKPKVIDTLKTYNKDEYNAIDGVALKACDRLSAFIEATISISYGVRSRELLQGKEQIRRSLEKNRIINNVNFYDLSQEIDRYFLQDI